MLWRILQAHGGTLPPDVKVLFENTGVERNETLDFVERCACERGVPVTWLEYRNEGPPMDALVDDAPKKRKRQGDATFAVVDYASASRNGEPFEALIRARNMLPNPVARFCTVELKIRTAQRYLKFLGWHGWTSAIGFRFDEPQRVAKLSRTNRQEREEPVAPLYDAKITKEVVAAFWRSHPFDLQLEQHEGNCTLCFLKGAGKIERILRARPDLAEWWLRMESLIKGGRYGTGRFRTDRPSYAAMLQRSKRALLPMTGDDGSDELSIACHCTD
jgi:3'-phosphoadenosine 5'-phosphosulfate sulfotransferase (PAPS reductase)/FAD synthetase